MNQHLQSVLNFFQQSEHFTEDEKAAFLQSVSEADKELEQKSNAVEAQNRELEIEYSLERVRTVAMSMKKPGDMLEICRIISEQLENLGIDEVRNVQTAIFNKDKGTYMNYEYYAKHNKPFITEVDYTVDEMTSSFASQMMKGPEEIFTRSLTGKELKDWYKFQQTTPQFADAYLAEASSLNYYWFSLGPIALGVSTYAPLNETEIILFNRFRNVFQLAYRRFLDIEIAEAQAREGQIELALERVRARTMAMQHSDELSETASEMFRQIQLLGLETWSCGFNIIDRENRLVKQWVSTGDGRILPAFVTPSDEDVFQRFTQSAEKDKSFYVEEMGGEALQAHYQYMASLPEVKKLLDEFQNLEITPPDFQVFHLASFSCGYLMFITYQPAPEFYDIFKRFAIVFDQTYRRFLDLQKAEAQTREAQIQLALERVRARTMAMQKSAELAETSSVLFQQINELGFETWSCGFCIWTKNDLMELWMGADSGQLLPPMTIPYKEEPTHRDIYEAFLRGELAHDKVWEGEALAEHYTFLKTIPSVEQAIEVLEKSGLTLPSRQCYYVGFFKEGYLLLITKEPNTELKDLSKRFAHVFDLTYTRFLDLQKAEAQAREAQIETALERVRSRTMAMQKSEELKEVIQVVYDQFVHLNILIEHTGFIMDYKARNDMHIWLADQHEIPSEVTIPYFDSPHWNSFNEAKEKGINFFPNHLDFEEKNRFYQELFKVIPGVTDETKEYYFSRPGVDISTVLLENVGLYIENYSAIPYTDEENATLMRFGKVFQQTYTRFLDLQKAEAQTREARINLAVERVRARALAMFKSEEILQVVHKLKEEILGLDIPNVIAATIHLKEKDGRCRVWDITSVEVNDDAIHHPMDIRFKLEDTHPNFFMRRIWGNTAIYFVEMQDEEDFEHTLQWLRDCDRNQQADETEQFLNDTKLKKLYHATIRLNSGRMCIDLLDAPAPEIESIMTKMGAAFDLAYKRFEDLKNSEAQLREAKIEAALERVRSRSLAMHNSDELQEVVNTVFERMEELDVILDSANIIIFTKGAKELEYWTSNNTDQVFASRFIIPYAKINVLDDLFAIKESGKDLFSKNYSLEEKNEFFHYLFEHSDFKNLSEERKKFILDSKQYSVTISFVNNIGIQLNSYSKDAFLESEIDILRRFAKVFQQTYIRFLDLQKAEAQAKEAKIEASLERVRAKTMAMHNSVDVGNTVAAMFDELLHLGLNNNARSGIGIIDESMQMEVWTAYSKPNDQVGLAIGKLNMASHPMLRGVFDSWKKKELHSSYFLTGEDEKDYYNAINQSANYSAKFDIESLPKKQYQNAFYFREGFIYVFSFEPLTSESIQILKRFAGVFEQTYIRFLDLQKAEAQAKEAKIEASLERVRAKAMAMHNSGELDEVLAVLFDQFDILGIVSVSTHMTLIDVETNTFTFRETGKAGHRSYGEQTVAIDSMDIWKEAADKWKSSTPFSINRLHFPKEALPQVWQVFQESFASMPDNAKIYPEDYPDGIYHTAGNCKFGYIGMNQTKKATEEEEQIVLKFAIEFGRLYQRFLDLQKAEAQAREANIEAALERVRSRTMAMQRSDDLSFTVATIFEQLKWLHLEFLRCGIAIINKQNKTQKFWTSAHSGNDTTVHLSGDESMSLHPLLQEAFEAWLRQEDYSYLLQGADLVDFYKAMESGNYKLPDAQSVDATDQAQYFFVTSFKSGQLYAFNGEPFTDSTKKLMKRFADVINLAYTRFRDLQRAEAQAKDAVRQASLDRVRAETASMRTTADLEKITPLMWNELTILDVPFIRCGVFIMDEVSEQVHTFLSTPDGKAIAAFQLPYDTPGTTTQIVKHWHKKEMYTDHWDEAALIEWTKNLVEKGAIASSEQYLTENRPTRLELHFLPFFQGMLYVGSEAVLNDDEIQVVQTLADAFSTAYARYEDFNKLEAAKQQVEITLIDLKQAQAQLIQSEKMASLGELTAGIAHEIQNPLNFVTNFSEVSNELMVEMVDELAKGYIDEAKAIAGDIKLNLEKINHHGKRADAIVKGMLQHSGSSSGQKEPTDINALADEYLRLAYHGLRAKEKSFSATLKTDYDHTIGNISIIPRDIGRVILNMISNAFYTVDEKKKATARRGENYEPTVSVTTKRVSTPLGMEGLEIQVADNGNGIPQKILDKIFQPFFTTKPTGQGTGLGLSLAYDIVKTYGGELKVETKEGKGSSFTIELPLR